jgi:hypothetical protein
MKAKNYAEFREKVVDVAVKAAHEFGYPDCNKNNMLTDEVYKLFFVSILRQSFGPSMTINDEIKKLINEIEGGGAT